MESLSEANARFGFDLFQQMRKSKEGNIFFSPLSISASFAMVTLGAANSTALQMEKVLHFADVTGSPSSDAAKGQMAKKENVHSQFRKLLTELNNPTDAYALTIANRLYVEQKYQLLQKYLDDAKKFYLSGAEAVNFGNAAEKSRKDINSWVEKQTHGKIQDLFPEGSLSSSTILVLVNAIYFKGQWDRKFNKEITEEEKFWQNKDTSKSVMMMKQRESFNLAFLDDMQAKILEIPYKGEDLSMFVLLPNEVDGLQKIEDTLSVEKFLEWTSPSFMKKTKVDLNLPRFRVEDKYSLSAMMIALGMVDAFSPQDADFSGMTGRRNLVLSKALHKAFVEVNEEGTEAAAATGIEAVPMSLPYYEPFHCNHPFVFFIKQKKTNSLLFFGRITSP
ncbi:serpin B3 [Echinops telfairi]|uniref:Serpin B3 n=1 Tax=Echinops telfairi TaxID=9371 RepID=A0ABM0IM24_ECHTE|nr:serpin B3 [Echinops telfairi]